MMVDLDFTLRLDDERIVATSEGREPLVFLQGGSRIMPALQQALIGMSVGDEKDVVVAAADGYGERDSDAVELVPRATFPAELALTQGMKLNMRDQVGRMHKAHVSDIRADGVLLDFNHPLAGETLYFRVKIAALRAATPEELAEQS
jgi:FKBP-type peptidyl-prolyl cis-trans isomerase SlyD